VLVANQSADAGRKNVPFCRPIRFLMSFRAAQRSHDTTRPTLKGCCGTFVGSFSVTVPFCSLLSSSISPVHPAPAHRGWV